MVRRGVVMLAVALAGVGLAVAVVGLVLAVVTPAGPVYSVAQVAAGLAHHPRAWVGRTVTVRGTFAAVVDDDSVDSGGVGGSYCWPNARCVMGLPTDVPLHIFLVGPTPRAIPAYAGMLAALLAARAPQFATSPLLMPSTLVHVWGTAPPALVVLVRPHRPSAAWARLSHMARQAATNLPDGSWLTLSQMPLVGPFFEQLLMPGTVHGGTPRLYRVRLLPPVPAARRTSCPLACDDALLLDNLH
jgi:hypothetical protein